MSQRYLAELERQVANLPSNRDGSPPDLDLGEDNGFSDDGHEPDNLRDSPPAPGGHNVLSESGESGQNGLRATPESDLRNPLDPTTSNAFTVDTGSKQFFL